MRPIAQRTFERHRRQVISVELSDSSPSCTLEKKIDRKSNMLVGRVAIQVNAKRGEPDFVRDDQAHELFGSLIEIKQA